MITYTEQAAAHINKLLAKEGAAAIGISVQPAGCSGFKYVMEFIGDVTELHYWDDYVLSVNDNHYIVVDGSSAQYLKGLELDFGKEGLNEAFKFNNPNMTSQCGCGESFHV